MGSQVNSGRARLKGKRLRLKPRKLVAHKQTAPNQPNLAGRRRRRLEKMGDRLEGMFKMLIAFRVVMGGRKYL